MTETTSTTPTAASSTSETSAADLGWTSRVLVTGEAAQLMRRLAAEHGDLMFHQSGGCCDGSSPMCYAQGEFIVGDRDVLLGTLAVGTDDESGDLDSEGPADIPVWISGSQYEAWKHTQLILDVVPGRGGGFSLESPTGMRFLTRSRVIPPEREASLPAIITGSDVEGGTSLPDGVAPIDLPDTLPGEICDPVTGRPVQN